MFDLTAEQRRELDSAEPTARDPETNETFILVPKSQYDRIKDQLYDDDPWTAEEMDLLAAEASEAANGFRNSWENSDAIRQGLIATGMTFSDSTDDIREDRDR